MRQNSRQRQTPQPSASQRELLASKSQAQHEEIMQQLNALDQQTPPVPRVPAAPSSESAPQCELAKEVEAKLSEIEQLEMAGSSQALLAGSSQTYGVCVNCGVETPFLRLHA